MIHFDQHSGSADGDADELLAELATGLLVVDLDSRITYLNSAAERLLGQTVQQIRERPSIDSTLHLLTMDGEAMPAEAWLPWQVSGTSTPVQDTRALFDLPDGKRVTVPVSANLAGNVAGEPAWLLPLRNIAERNGVEEVVRRHMTTLRAQAGLLDLATERGPGAPP
jgi:PAS domain S-box-containing protein